MEILVNREPLDFSLENESSLGEVVDGLATWLYSGQFAITSLDVNDTTYAIHDRDAWAGIEISHVDRLAVEALPVTDVDHATLIALDEYCALLGECLESGSAEPLPDVVAELPYVRARLGRFFPSLVEEDGSVAVFRSSALEAGELPSERERGEIMDEIASVRSIVRSREHEYRAPERELALSLGQLAGSADRLIEAPVQLQTGQQGTAMQTIIALTELLSRVMRLLPLVERTGSDLGINLDGVKGFAEEIAPLLVELKEAFEIQDTVLLGDLLEYEIAPRLEALGDLMPEEDGE